MRNFTVLFFLILFSLAAFAQKPSKKPARAGSALSSSAPSVSTEKKEFERAAALADATARIAALRKFVDDFPKASERTRVLELMTSARAQAADEKMRAGDAAGAVALFKSAVEEAPTPLSDKLFADVIMHIPTNVFFGGERVAASEIARTIESKIEGNPRQILGLATFYLGVENGDEAKRLAEKAVALDANLPAAFQMLGLASRMNFNLEQAESAYSKALELDAASVVSKRSLAEMKRALGKSDEAATLYREILEKNPADALAANGLILALFDGGKRAEAETEMRKSLEQNPNNLNLLVGAAYWYAAHGDAARAVELGEKAVALEPRYVWGHVALARAYSGENRLFEAERTLLAARAYGNFPTLDYELATVRAAGGFYREAAEELSKSFRVRDDAISVKLGGRVEKQAANFTDLISSERRASIFEPTAADDAENAQRLKNLVDFYQKSESSEAANDAAVAQAAEKFVDGGDGKTKIHRRLYAADVLLKKRKSLSKADELIKSAPAEIDAALDAPNAASAVLADELYASRQLTIAKNQLVIVPAVARQTLSNILRGRIEEISGAILLENNKPSEAVVRLRRALSVLPDKSAWWRSSMWRLGAALEADGKSAEALAAYTKSYANQAVYNQEKRAVIESLYRKVNGNLDGLDAAIGARPVSSEAVSTAIQKTENDAQTAQNQTASADAAPKTEDAPRAAAEVKPTPEVVAKTAPTPEEKLIKSDAPPVADASPKTETAVRRSGKRPIENSGGTAKKADAEKAAKPLFEPVIINVPKVENTPAAETGKKPDASENPTDKRKEDARAQTSVDGKSEPAKCELTFSQESVSLINNGGNLGVLVGLDGDGDALEIRAFSNSDKDVEVVLEPEIAASSNRAYFIFKSISRKTGVFTVEFQAPCGGKKNFVVNVR